MAANRIAIVFAFGVFLLNLLLGSWDAAATGDGYEEIRLLREQQTPRPQHLLLTPTWRGLHEAMSTAVPAMTPLRTIVIANAACGAIALGLALAIATSLGIGAAAAASALAVLAVSWAWWTHSRDPETTMLSHALLVASVFVLVRGRTWSNRARVLSVTLFTLAATMAANVLTTMPMLVLLERWKSARPWNDLRTILFAVALVLPFLGVAAWQYATHGEQIGAPFSAWIRHHSSEEMMGAIPKGASAVGVLRAGSGLLRTFLPLQGGVPATAKLLLTGRQTENLDGAAIAEFAITAASALLLFVLFARAVIAANQHRPVVQAFAAGFLGTALGCWIWLGSDPQFWLPIFPFVFIGAAAGWKALRGTASRLTAAAAMAALLFFLLANSSWPTPSIVRRQGGPIWREAGEFCKTSNPGDLLILQDTIWSFYALERCRGMRGYRLLYETSAAGDDLMAELETAIDATHDSGGRVMVEDLCAATELEHLGFWENMALVKRAPREQICARLGERYKMVEISRERKPRLLELKRRS